LCRTSVKVATSKYTADASPGRLCNGSAAQIPEYQHWMGPKDGPAQSATDILAAIFDLYRWPLAPHSLNAVLALALRRQRGTWFLAPHSYMY
jgi:hypothetical protein